MIASYIQLACETAWRIAMILVAVVTIQLTAGCARVKTDSGTETIVIAGDSFTLELAIDTTTRTRGLMYRREISSDGGMLFIFQRDGI